MSAPRILAALFVLACAAATPALAAKPSAAPANRPGQVEGLLPAAKSLYGCTRSSRRLLVDIVIDGSASLRVNDPEDRRVDGVGAALFGLARHADRSTPGSTPLRVEVLLSSFAGRISPRDQDAAWQRLGPKSLSRLLDRAESLSRRDNGRDTDYAVAFSAAHAALTSRARAIADADGTEPCKAMIFLSDGRYHIGRRDGSTSLPRRVFYARQFDLGKPGSGRKAVKAGHRYLCEPGGLRDRMADQEIVTFTVGLSAPGGLNHSDRQSLEALTTGRAGGASCGTELSARNGAFLDTRDSRDLFFNFASIVDPWLPFCMRCPNPSEFDAPAGLSGFVLSATALRPGLQLALQAPNAKRATFASEGDLETRLAGASVSQHWIRSRSMEIQARFDHPTGASTGLWRFRFFNPTDYGKPLPVYSLSLQSDLEPELLGDPELAAGSTNSVRVRLVDGEGNPVPRSWLTRAARMDVRLVDSTGVNHRAAVTRTAPGRFTVRAKVPEAAPSGEWKLAAAISFPDARTPVADGDFTVPIAGPPGAAPPPPWLLALICAALGALLLLAALVVLHLRRLAQAKFPPPQSLHVFTAEVTAGKNRGLELDPDPGVADFDDFERLNVPGRGARSRTLELHPFELRASLPWRPRSRPEVRATAGGRRLIGGTTSGSLTTSEDGTSCAIPLDLAGTWLFAADPVVEEGTVRGDLVAITDVSAPLSQCRELIDAARSSLGSNDWSEFEPQPGVGLGDQLDSDLPDLPDDLDNVDWEKL